MADQVVLRHVTKQFTTRTLGAITAVNDFNLTVYEGCLLYTSVLIVVKKWRLAFDPMILSLMTPLLSAQRFVASYF